ncbi:thymidylate synthase [Niveispirillum lacus]|nr:thymidylate synthase [Niveispirillum lacus]
MFSSYDSATDACRELLACLLNAPQRGAGGVAAESRLRRPFREELNTAFVLSNPRKRISQSLQLYPATARVIWMMAANNRLSDIKFHVPQVGNFTDDELTVPGSSYGMRLRQPQPGLDQIEGAIKRLKAETDSRRAAVTIFQPVDAIRESNDIPCAFGILFHNRDKFLETTVIMRSNNACALLPFNLFEFSLLAEVVAVEAGLELGPITYFAGSMHLYESDIERAKGLLAESVDTPFAMEQMPCDKSPLKALKRLAQADVKLREASTSLNITMVNEIIADVENDFGPYWSLFAKILACGVAASRDFQTFSSLIQLIDPNLKRFLPKMSQNVADINIAQIGGLFGRDVSSNVVVPIRRNNLMKRFAEHAVNYEAESGQAIGAAVLLRAQDLVFERFAARGDDDVLSYDAFRRALDGQS